MKRRKTTMPPKNGKALEMNSPQNGEALKEWTIMFFCAGDNELAPLIISQLKGIKEAGPDPKVDVLVYVDPNEKGVPTRVYCVNQDGGPPKTASNDTFILNLEGDILNLESGGPAAKDLKDAIEKADIIEVNVALEKFLLYCEENHRAKHYALVLLGHGMIVANDAFLPDESPVSSIELKQLRKTLNVFKSKLDLLGLHSCSMSGIEVAYELQGKADYMIASEGLSFVGSWPYRQLVKRVCTFINEPPESDSKTENSKAANLIEKLYHLAYYNAKDFMLSGYSLDLALCSLDQNRYEGLTTAIRRLVIEMKAGLDKTIVKDGLVEPSEAQRAIQLAHLESQSYFVENYTDLYDFCLLLSKNCKSAELSGIKEACQNVMERLKSKEIGTDLDDFKGVVIHARHFGSQYQHSHGLSVYFPWSPPVGDTENSVLEKYAKYEFTRALGKETSWLDFLTLYLRKTEREPRGGSIKVNANGDDTSVPSGGALPGGDHKPSGGSGPACSCPSIKNFPTVTKIRNGKTIREKTVVMTEGPEATVY